MTLKYSYEIGTSYKGWIIIYLSATCTTEFLLPRFTNTMRRRLSWTCRPPTPSSSSYDEDDEEDLQEEEECGPSYIIKMMLTTGWINERIYIIIIINNPFACAVLRLNYQVICLPQFSLRVWETIRRGGRGVRSQDKMIRHPTPSCAFRGTLWNTPNDFVAFWLGA